MKRNLTYSRAVEILTAFLGSDIIVEERGHGKHKECKVAASYLTKENKIAGASIIQRQSWEEVLRDLLPTGLQNNGKALSCWEIGYVSQVYRFRHIGKAIKERSRLAIRCNTNEDGDTPTKVQRSTEQH